MDPLRRPVWDFPQEPDGVDGFRSYDDQRWYEARFLQRGVTLERRIGDCPTGYTPPMFRFVRSYQGWYDALRYTCDANITWCREFAASLVRKSKYHYAAFVRGCYIDLDPATVSAVTGVPLADNFECPFSSQAEEPNWSVIASKLYGTRTIWDGIEPRALDQNLLRDEVKGLYLVLVGSIFPSSQKKKIYPWLARILHAIYTRKRVDLCRLWIRAIVGSAEDTARHIVCGVLITRLCIHAGVPRREHDEMVRPKGPIGLASINRSRGQKRNRVGGDEDMSDDEESGDEMPPAVDPTADIAHTTVDPSGAGPSQTYGSGPSQTYGGGAAPDIGGVMQLLERLLKGQEDDRVTAQERYMAVMAQQAAMGVQIDELRDEVRSTMTSVRARFARTDNQLQRIYTRMPGGSGDYDGDDDEGDDEDEDDNDDDNEDDE